jgi:hypothetical protein
MPLGFNGGLQTQLANCHVGWTDAEVLHLLWNRLSSVIPPDSYKVKDDVAGTKEYIEKHHAGLLPHVESGMMPSGSQLRGHDMWWWVPADCRVAVAPEGLLVSAVSGVTADAWVPDRISHTL